MKKLIIAMAIAVSAVLANASSVSWGVSVGQTLDSTKIDAGTMYLVYTANAAGIDWGKLDSMASFDESTIAAIGFEKVVSSFEYSADKVSNKESITPASSGLTSGSKAMYMICIDDGGTEIAYTASSKSVNVQSSALTVGITTSASAFTYASAQAIPEPTSALMLLLGMAGLALRRKQA